MCNKSACWNSRPLIEKIVFATNIIRKRRDIEHDPHKYLSNVSGGVQASASQTPDPDPLLKRSLSYVYSPCGMLCFCIHWVLQNTKQYPFLIHAGSFYYTICVLFSFLETVGFHKRELYHRHRKWPTVNRGWSVSPSIQRNHHSEPPRDTSINKTKNGAELAGIVAALINEHNHIATDDAGAVWQTRNKKHPLPPAHEMALNAKLLVETTVHHIQQLKNSIHFYQVKSSYPFWHASSGTSALTP